MNKSIWIGILSSALLLSTSTLAQEKVDQKAGSNPPAQKQGAGPNQAMQGMQAGMKRMQDLMGRIQASKDPKEVELLLVEHMKLMREQMKAMRGMMGQGMMGQGMMGSGMMDGSGMKGEGPKGGGMISGDMMMNREAMMGHMMIMHGMMEQMLEHMEAEHHRPPGDTSKKQP